MRIEEHIYKKRYSILLKRVFDFFASFLGLLVLSPIFLIISIIIKLSSKGHVFFKQERVGKNGKLFKIFKFRTMVEDAEVKGAQITVGKDPRITKEGTFLRKLRIDELPQLINVLIGDMSLVGPRPEVPKYVEKYNEMQRQVLLVKPGITELASIKYKNEAELLEKSDNPEETYINEIMPAKLIYNLYYIETFSFWGDIKLIFTTFKKVFFER